MGWRFNHDDDLLAEPPYRVARSLTLGLPALEIAGRSSWAATIPGRDWEKAPSPEADMVVAAKAATSP